MLFFFAPSTSKFREKKAEMQKKAEIQKKCKNAKKKQKMHVRFQN